MMHKIWVIFLFIIFTANGFAQSPNRLYGISFQSQNEIRSRMIYQSPFNDNKKVDYSFGAGIRVQDKLNADWGYTIGLNYIKKTYNMRMFYDHCFDLPSGYACNMILTSVPKFGYHTIELPMGINRYFKIKNKFQFYTSLTGIICYDFQSFYGTQKLNKIHLFSGSIVGGVGTSYKISEGIKLAFEPFVRLLYKQKIDPIILVTLEKTWATFDNLGGSLVLMYTL